MSLLSIGSSVSGLAGLGSGIAQNFFGSKRDGAKSRYNIEDFKSKLNELGGLYKPSLYVVRMYPSFIDDWWSTDSSARGMGVDSAISPAIKGTEPLTLLCNSAQLPGVQIITSDHRRQNMGTFDRRPFGAMVTDIPLTFMIDNAGYTLKFFNQWLNNVVRYQIEGGPSEMSSLGNHQAGLFETSYRNRYICRVEITCLAGTQGDGRFKGIEGKSTEGHDFIRFGKRMEGPVGENNEKGIQVIRYTLQEAFPMQMGDVTVAWAENDSFSSLPIQFTFRSYEIEKFNIPNPIAQQSFSLSETLGLIAGASGVIGSYGGGVSKQTILTNGINMLNNKQTLGRFLPF